MRELSLSEIGMVSGGAGAVVEGAVMGTGVGVVARGANIAAIGAKKIMSDISTNSVRAAIGTGAVAGSINGFTQLAVKNISRQSWHKLPINPIQIR